MKVYITRDGNSDDVWIWLKPVKGNWKPEPIKSFETINYQRTAMDEIDTYCSYYHTDFKKKFDINLKKGEIRSVYLPDKTVLDNKLAKLPLWKGWKKKSSSIEP